MREFLKKQVEFLPWKGRLGGVDSCQPPPLTPPARGRTIQWKNKGIVILLPTIILSGLILVVGLGLSQVLMTELEFSADLLFSEKAYFAAESGVEKSLLALKGKPLNYVVEENISVGSGATYDLNIANQVGRFEFNLNQNESIKFRLGYDDNRNFAGYDLIPVTNFSVSVDSSSVFPQDFRNNFEQSSLQWKILCLQNNNEGIPAKKTVALFGTGKDFTKGTQDDGENIAKDKNVSDFLSLNNKPDNICFMSLTNFGTEKFHGVFQPKTPSIIAPAKVNITAIGKSFSREKIVSFDYWQKNLSAVYDLGLFYTGSSQ